MEEKFGLSHLFMTVFLYCFATLMVVPAITDVTMAAVCPGQYECSFAIYLTGAQHVIIGVGSVVVMPLIGKLSDTHGRKLTLTLPLTLSIFPLLILAYNSTKYYFYAYYVLKTLIAIATEGSVQFLALAYVADNVEESRRASAFAIMSGFSSSSFVLGNFSTRFLSTSATFQVAAAMSVFALLYMRLFLPDSICVESECLLEKAPSQKWKIFNILDSFHDTICLLRSSSVFSKAVVVAFFGTVAEVGFHASLMYYLKARFHFNKDQFADLMIIGGIAESASQMIVMPMLTPLLGEEKIVSIGLFSSCACMIVYSIAWSPLVPYVAATISIFSTFTHPSLRSIASKQVGPNEQGKAQGCITGICSLANVVSPLAFTPLTALFISNNAPFYFPGFSIMCSSFVAVIAFAMSITMIRPPPPPPPPVEDYCSIMISKSLAS
ncbi:Major facilitator superfamily protein [Perilla frutescens var. hirtella]|nr:Major facilitator superfamily protein [Perilla frutescens var. hirtella]